MLVHLEHEMCILLYQIVWDRGIMLRKINRDLKNSNLKKCQFKLQCLYLDQITLNITLHGAAVQPELMKC